MVYHIPLCTNLCVSCDPLGEQHPMRSFTDGDLQRLTLLEASATSAPQFQSSQEESQNKLFVLRNKDLKVKMAGGHEVGLKVRSPPR